MAYIPSYKDQSWLLPPALDDLIPDDADGGHLKPQVEQAEQNLGGLPEGLVWSCDAGYYESGNLEFMVEKKIDGYVPDNNEGKSRQPFDKKNFSYDGGQDR